MDEILNAFSRFSCFDAGYIEGLVYVMDPSIRPLAADMRFTGRAFTHDEINAISKSIFDEIEPEQVLVVRGGDPLGRGGCGLQVCELVAQRGAAGIVLDGYAQDTPKLLARGFPIFCRGAVPTHGPLRLTGRSGVPIRCAGVPVNPGDIVMGDRDGVVVIPQENAAEVLKQIELMREARDYVDGMTRSGVDLWDVPGLKEMWAEKEQGLEEHWRVYERWNEQHIPPEMRRRQ